MADKNEQVVGGLSTVTDAADQPDANAQATGIQTKGMNIPGIGKTTGSLAIDLANDPEYLQNMQKMIDQRTGGFKTFLDSMKDAVAITSRDPGSAMAARDQEKRLEQQSIFEMRNTMAALQAAKRQQDQFAARQSADFGGTSSGTAGGLPAAGTTNPSSAAVKPGNVMYRGIEIPQAFAQALQNARNEDERLAIWNTKVLPHIGKMEEVKATAELNPDLDKPITVFANGQSIPITVRQLRGMPQTVRDKIDQETFAKFGYIPSAEASKVAPTVAPSTAVKAVPGSAAAVAQSLGVPIISGDRDFAKQTELYNASQQPGYKGPPVAKPGTSQHEVGNAIDLASNATEEHKQKLRDAGFVNPYPNDPNHWELRGAKPVAAAAPTPTTSGPNDAHPTWNAPFTPISTPKPAFANSTEESNWYAAQKKVQEDDAADKGKFLASGKMFEPTLNTISELRNQAKGHEEIFDLTGKHPWKAVGMDLLHMTSKTPAEEQIARQNLSPDSRTVFKNVQAGAAKIQSDKAIADAQTGGGRLTRMGQELAGKTKGVGTDSTYGSFMTNLAILEEEARTKQNQIAFANAHKDIPMNQIENHPYWLNGAREDARRETAKNYADLPAAGYSGRDKNGRLWVVKDGKKVYAE